MKWHKDIEMNKIVKKVKKMDTNRDTNPYKLKEKEVNWKEEEKIPGGYLDSSLFLLSSKKRS
jgi:hypothetical protein